MTVIMVCPCVIERVAVSEIANLYSAISNSKQGWLFKWTVLEL